VRSLRIKNGCRGEKAESALISQVITVARKEKPVPLHDEELGDEDLSSLAPNSSPLARKQRDRRGRAGGIVRYTGA
jgi:hypothetical protein